MMNSYTTQTAQFLVVYILLFTLGVLFEARIPFHLPTLFQYSQNVQHSETPPVFRARKHLQGDIRFDKGNKYPTEKSQETKNLASLSIPYVSESTVYVSPVRSTKNKSISDYESTNRKIKATNGKYVVKSYNNNGASIALFEERSLVREVSLRVQLSPELNAFDELVDLLTASKTRCLEVGSYFKPANNTSGDFKYYCSVHRFRQCIRRSFSKRSARRCPRYSRSGYYVNTIRAHSSRTNIFEETNLQNTQRFAKVNTENSNNFIIRHQEETQDGGKLFGERDESAPFQQSVTVDAQYSFLQELRNLGTSHISVRLDFILDLTGLNSIHKYEVVVKLLQELRWRLNQQGYVLVRSSTDSAHLLGYLHQEGLQKPIEILTLWNLNKSF